MAPERVRVESRRRPRGLEGFPRVAPLERLEGDLEVGLRVVREELHLPAQLGERLRGARAREHEGVREVDAAPARVLRDQLVEPAAGLVHAAREGGAHGAAGQEHELPFGFRDVLRQLADAEGDQPAGHDEPGIVGRDLHEDVEVLRRGREVAPPHVEQGLGEEPLAADLRCRIDAQGHSPREVGLGLIEVAQVILGQSEEGPPRARRRLQAHEATQGVASLPVAAGVDEELAEPPPAVVPERIQGHPRPVEADGLDRLAGLGRLVRPPRQLLERYARHPGRFLETGQRALGPGGRRGGEAGQQHERQHAGASPRHSI